jgi:hypothetical protein
MLLIQSSRDIKDEARSPTVLRGLAIRPTLAAAIAAEACWSINNDLYGEWR